MGENTVDDNSVDEFLEKRTIMDDQELDMQELKSTTRQKCKICPFCGSIPYVDLGKKGSCQLHGEPFQAIIVHCKNHGCPAKPSVSAGDIYNGGRDKAESEAIALWNQRAV